MLTADQNIVDVKFSVSGQVTDPERTCSTSSDPENMVAGAAESAMREVVGRRPAQDIFRDDRASIRSRCRRSRRAMLDSYGSGVQIDQITIENVAPPPEVADAFDEVQRAEQDEERFQEEARGDANTVLGRARGQASQIREDAAAYKDRVVKEAQGEAARFTSVYGQYVQAPEVTRKRLYLETIEQVMGGASKVVVDKSASGGVVPYLPLPQLKPPTQAGIAAGTTNNASGNAATGVNSSTPQSSGGTLSAPSADTTTATPTGNWQP